MLQKLRNEPALLGNLIVAAVALAAGFGFNIGEEYLAAVVAVLAAVTGVNVRRQVTPV